MVFFPIDIPVFWYKIGIMKPDFIYINRDLKTTFKKYLSSGKVLVIYGPRQAGKTTFVRHLFTGDKKTLYLSCDHLRVREQIKPDALLLKSLIGSAGTVILDEAQYLDNAGLVLKIMKDSFPALRLIATGSSSFDLANKLSEPLTGRHYTFLLLPLSLAEIKEFVSAVDYRIYLEQTMLYGSYPGVFRLPSTEEKIRLLNTLTDDYLYRDILVFNLVRNSQKVRDLLIALALQLGGEVSYQELGTMIGMDRKTIEHYLDLMEKSFIVFRLRPFSRNRRKELSGKVKVYFYDLGVRNSLINNFNPLQLRTDKGAIWENVVVAEMVKKEVNKAQKASFYFWRTYQGQEVDLITEKNGRLTAYEIKYQDAGKNHLNTFKSFYPEAETKLITFKHASFND